MKNPDSKTLQGFSFLDSGKIVATYKQRF
jgi:hypothetical protein